MTSPLQKLEVPVKLPFDREALMGKDPVKRADYFEELVKTLEELLEELTRNSNFALALADGEAVYYILPDATGEYPDGTWRRIQVGDNLEDQRKENGIFVKAHKRVPRKT